MLASGVCAPAAKFTAERDMLPVTGNAPDTMLATLAAPRPINSWLLTSFSLRFKASDCAADMLMMKITKPTSKPGCSSGCQCAGDMARFSCGRPLGTLPVVFTPIASSPSTCTRTSPSMTTSIGARRVAISAAAAFMPKARSKRARWLRDSTSSRTEPRPSAALGPCQCGSSAPSKGLSWPQAINSAEPTVKPLMTGREKKLARKPSRSRPHSSSTAPATSASCAASTEYRPEPAAAIGPIMAAVISDTIAIGPTDCVMLVPNSA